jgi:hypothetical protein
MRYASKEVGLHVTLFGVLFAYLLSLQNKCTFVINLVPLKCVKDTSIVTWKTYLLSLQNKCTFVINLVPLKSVKDTSIVTWKTYLLSLQYKCTFVINLVPLKSVKDTSIVTWKTFLFHRTRLYSRRCCCKICCGRGRGATVLLCLTF